MVRILLVSIMLYFPVLSQQAPDGVYRVEQEREVSHDIDEEQYVTYTVVDREGREQYTVRREVVYDAAFPSAGVFESGKLIIIDSFTGIVEIYNTEGEEVKTVTLPGAGDVEHERNIDFSFHGDRVALVVSEPAYKYIRFFIADESGEILVQEQFDISHATGIVYSPDGSLLAVGAYGWEGKSLRENMIFVTDEGEVLGTVDAGFRNGFFTDDGSSFIGYTNSQAHLIDAEEFKLRWSYRIEEDRIILDAELNGAGLVVLSSDKPDLIDGTWMYENPVVRTIERNDGAIISEQRFPEVTFTTGTFLREEDEIMLKFDDTVQQFDR